MTDPNPDPNAPTQHTLPSGLEVTLRSYRTLKRPEMHTVWAALGAPGEHDALIELLVTASSNPEFPVPFTIDVLDRLDDGADYIALYKLVGNAWRMVNGLTVIPNPDDHQDPKAPTTASNGSAPASAATSSLTSAEPGTTSPTTNTSTAPGTGRPAS